MNEEQKVYQIDILRIVSLLIKRWWAIVLAAMIFATAGYGYAKYNYKPVYSSNVLLLVNNSSSVSIGGKSIGLTAKQLASSSNYIDTYIVILNSRKTLEKVIDKANLSEYGITYESLKSSITAGAENDTAIFNITVTNNDPQLAKTIVTTITEVLPTTITEIITGTSVGIVDNPSNAVPITTNDTGKKAAIGFILGVVLGVAVIVILDVFNDTIYSEDWITKTFGEEAPLLTVMPDVNNSTRGYYRYSKYAKYGYYRREYTSKKDEIKNDKPSNSDSNK